MPEHHNRVDQHFHQPAGPACGKPKSCSPGDDCGDVAVIVQTLSLGLVKTSEETYLFIYPNTAAGNRLMHEALARFAGNPELSFNWADAEELSEQAGSM